MNTYTKEIRRYAPTIFLDEHMSRKKRRALRVLFLAIVFASSIAFLFFYYAADLVTKTIGGDSYFFLPQFYGGIFFLAFSYLTILYLISFFYNTLYYRGLDFIIKENFDDERGITYEVARAIKQDTKDVTATFLISEYGRRVLYRAGMDISDVDRFLRQTGREKISIESIPFPEHGFLTLEDIGMFIHGHDNAFHEFILKRGKNDEMYQGALKWVSRGHIVEKYKSKWWGRDNLGKVKCIGKELSFGVAYDLQRFMRPIVSSAVFSLFSRDSAYADELIEKIEIALSRTKAANVILVGEPGVGKMDILIELGRRMSEGVSASSILGKHLIVFDKDAFISVHNSKDEFEYNFLHMLLQAEQAGNIIVIIENIAAFLTNIEALGVNAGDLLDRFLASPYVQIVVTADPSSYHEYVETQSQFISRFEHILVENPTLESTIRVLEGVAETHEAEYGVFFTYPAIAAIAEGADRYIVEGAMPDKAVSLLSDIAARANRERVVVIKKEYAETSISDKTGIPLGPVEEEEKEKLLNLEEHLHKRVIGQRSAIDAIASALRRSRVGIQAKDKPLGSFLFLGSTGVGKTETAKALAHVFFGSEEHMMRLDMTEYNGEDALGRLIGGRSGAGSLPTLLRSHPYGVVLLDEFEKASSDIHDIFLQVFDEGLFTDGRGKRVNARNIIFIATSNAGSDIIWDMAGRGEDPSNAKDEIINAIIEKGILKPELINRFDASVIFKTLAQDEQRDIARLMLEELKQRIDQKGYTLVINDDLIDLLVEKGFNPEFGARPMRRVLQDDIEERVASKIIAGGLKYGDEIVFTLNDFMESRQESA